MPARSLVAQELAKILSVLSHPHRIQIVEELGKEERDVKTLMKELQISQARVSQHLSVMRSNRIVEERKEGRRVFYHLAQPELANWLLEGLEFIKADILKHDNLLPAVRQAAELWRQSES